MRKMIINLMFMLTVTVCIQAQGQVFYYDEFGGKIYLERDSKVKFIQFTKSTDEHKKTLIAQLEALSIKVEALDPCLYKISGDFKQEQAGSLLLKSLKNDIILYFSDMLKTDGPGIQWESNEIIVKTFPDTRLSDLFDSNKVPFKEVRRLEPDPQTYVVALDISGRSAIEYANMLMERKAVEWAQASFWRSVHTQNPYYSQQWNLNNTGQYGGTPGIDIRAVNAWTLSNGSNIKVALLDDGVDLAHPDLINNLLPGYDVTGGGDGAVNGNSKGLYTPLIDSHGNGCAGIIAASDNNIGVKGVAYGAKIIPARIFYTKNDGKLYFYETIVADGINKAWSYYKADILSFSWIYDRNSAAINQAIGNALTQGRNSLGCVVVCAVGNYNSAVSYPANSNSEILAVGAISPCGTRKRSSSDPNDMRGPDYKPDPLGVSCDGEKDWGSNYGPELDVVAPGVLIPTTDIRGNAGYNPNKRIHPDSKGNKVTSDYSDQNYTVWFRGTSSACPHVAGVAALVLSANPKLTGRKVRDIIESTARKVGGYSYQTTSGRLNGTWHQEMGYGLVDAYAAVQKAFILGPGTIPCYSTVTYSVPSSLPVPTWSVSSNVQIVSGQGTRTVTVKGAAINSGTISGSITASSSSYTISNNISIAQPPYVTSVSGPTSVRTGNYAVYTASPIISSSEGTYEWVVSSSSGVTVAQYGYMCDVTFSQPGSYSVSCRTKNACISGGSYTMAYVNVTSGSSYSAAANIFNAVTVTYNPPTSGPSLSPSQSLLSKPAMVDYKLVSLTTGTTVASGRMPSTGGTLDFSGVAAGIYILHIDDGSGTPETFKIVLH